MNWKRLICCILMWPLFVIIGLVLLVCLVSCVARYAVTGRWNTDELEDFGRCIQGEE